MTEAEAGQKRNLPRNSAMAAEEAATTVLQVRSNGGVGGRGGGGDGGVYSAAAQRPQQRQHAVSSATKAPTRRQRWHTARSRQSADSSTTMAKAPHAITCRLMVAPERPDSGARTVVHE